MELGQLSINNHWTEGISLCSANLIKHSPPLCSAHPIAVFTMLYKKPEDCLLVNDVVNYFSMYLL
ncbi:hypothetical protein GQ55_4G349000 [Panicum hallii var. hallii]|uniref:Uncharacterized protein n=1 Tax=Panicum hallii var. hallii TaxID=1504633 RepID=A0A2T7E3D1_9POAL|nr:hypothetical protein GQ55_4G349000 [Panicum hallii var. hallii]